MYTRDQIRGKFSSLDVICVSYTLKHLLQFTGLLQGKKCYPNRSMLHCYISFSFCFIIIFLPLPLLTLWHSDQLSHIPHPWGDEAVLETQVPCSKMMQSGHTYTQKNIMELKHTDTHTRTHMHTQRKITFLWEGNHLQLCLWINICVSVFANWIHNWKMLRPISMMKSILVC